MPADVTESDPRAELRAVDDGCVIALSGRWQITQPLPKWEELSAGQPPGRVTFDVSELTGWDSSLVLFVSEVCNRARLNGTWCDLKPLPPALVDLVHQLEDKTTYPIPSTRYSHFFSIIGIRTLDIWEKTRELSNFVGECVLSASRMVSHPHKFRWRDCFSEMQQCGAMALPIVGLIAFLVGVTLAYTGAIILRQFGGDIWVADLVGLSMTREMGAMMAGIVLAGRTGAAFAAEIGNMRANEEVDALVTLGIHPIDFLVLPRIVALGVMMPLLAVYSNALGIIGGMAIAWGLLDIPPPAYWVEMLSIVDLSDLLTGVIKATTFGVIIGLSGCLRGLQADRSASGVGQAATSAVVTAILLIIVADSLYAVVFNILGW